MALKTQHLCFEYRQYAGYILTANFVLRIIQFCAERNVLKAVVLREYICFVQVVYNLVVCHNSQEVLFSAVWLSALLCSGNATHELLLWWCPWIIYSVTMITSWSPLDLKKSLWFPLFTCCLQILKTISCMSVNSQT